MTKNELTSLVEELRKTVEMQAETIRALLAVVAHMQQPQITLAPIPAHPTILPTPWPPYTPYIGDPPFWPNRPGWVSTPNIGTAPLPNTLCGTSQLGRAECRINNTQEG